ncbi:MAG: cysteine peptidase family C39 domain-containing protein, partial [Candidatus Omnitrophota bacterium]
MNKNPKQENQAELKPGLPEKATFKSSFKAWIRVVAFIVVAVFLPEQVAQAVEYDWRVLWQKPGSLTPYSPNLTKDLRQLDIPIAIRNILKDISGKPINAIKISPTLTINLEKPLNISKQRIEEIYNWLVGKPCGSKALYDFLAYKGVAAQEQDIAVMALTTDILSGVLKPEGNPKVIKNSLYALSRASEFFGAKLYPVKLDLKQELSQKENALVLPFIAHLKGDHYILVTRITDEKIYFADEHKEEFLPKGKFLDKFSGYALVPLFPVQAQLLSDKEAQGIKGAGEDGDYYAADYQYYDDWGSSYDYSDYFSAVESTPVVSMPEYMLPNDYGMSSVSDYSNFNGNVNFSGVSPVEMTSQFNNNLNYIQQQNPNADIVVRNDPNMGVVFETYAHAGYGNSINVYSANDNSVISQGFHDSSGNTYHSDFGNTFYAKDSMGTIQSTGYQAEFAAGQALNQMVTPLAYTLPNIASQNITSGSYENAIARAQNGETVSIPTSVGSTVFYNDKGMVKMEVYNDDLRTVNVSQVTDKLTIPLAQGTWDSNNNYSMHDIAGAGGGNASAPVSQNSLTSNTFSANVTFDPSGPTIARVKNGEIIGLSTPTGSLVLYEDKGIVKMETHNNYNDGTTAMRVYDTNDFSKPISFAWNNGQWIRTIDPGTNMAYDKTPSGNIFRQGSIDSAIFRTDFGTDNSQVVRTIPTGTRFSPTGDVSSRSIVASQDFGLTANGNLVDLGTRQIVNPVSIGYAKEDGLPEQSVLVGFMGGKANAGRAFTTENANMMISLSPIAAKQALGANVTGDSYVNAAQNNRSFSVEVNKSGGASEGPHGQYNAFNVTDNIIRVSLSGNDNIAWDLSTGARMVSGDTVYGYAGQQLYGVGATPEFQSRHVDAGNFNNMYRVTLSRGGEMLLGQGRMTFPSAAPDNSIVYGGVARISGQNVGFETHGASPSLYSLIAGTTNVNIGLNNINAVGSANGVKDSIVNASGQINFSGANGGIIGYSSSTATGVYSSQDLRTGVVKEGVLIGMTSRSGALNTESALGRGIGFVGKGEAFVPAIVSDGKMVTGKGVSTVGMDSNPTNMNLIGTTVIKEGKLYKEAIALGQGTFPLLLNRDQSGNYAVDVAASSSLAFGPGAKWTGVGDVRKGDTVDNNVGNVGTTNLLVTQITANSQMSIANFVGNTIHGADLVFGNNGKIESVLGSSKQSAGMLTDTQLNQARVFSVLTKEDGVLKTSVDRLVVYKEYNDKTGWQAPQGRIDFAESMKFNIRQDKNGEGEQAKRIVAQDTRLTQGESAPILHYLVQNPFFVEPGKEMGGAASAASYALGYTLNHRGQAKAFENDKGILTAQGLMPAVINTDQSGNIASFNIINRAEGLSYEYQGSNVYLNDGRKLKPLEDYTVTVEDGEISRPTGVKFIGNPTGRHYTSVGDTFVLSSVLSKNQETAAKLKLKGYDALSDAENGFSRLRDAIHAHNNKIKQEQTSTKPSSLGNLFNKTFKDSYKLAPYSALMENARKAFMEGDYEGAKSSLAKIPSFVTLETASGPISIRVVKGDNGWTVLDRSVEIGNAKVSVVNEGDKFVPYIKEVRTTGGEWVASPSSKFILDNTEYKFTIDDRGEITTKKATVEPSHPLTDFFSAWGEGLAKADPSSMADVGPMVTQNSNLGGEAYKAADNFFSAWGEGLAKADPSSMADVGPMVTQNSNLGGEAYKAADNFFSAWGEGLAKADPSSMADVGPMVTQNSNLTAQDLKEGTTGFLMSASGEVLGVLYKAGWAFRDMGVNTALTNDPEPASKYYLGEQIFANRFLGANNDIGEFVKTSGQSEDALLMNYIQTKAAYNKPTFELAENLVKEGIDIAPIAGRLGIVAGDALLVAVATAADPALLFGMGSVLWNVGKTVAGTAPYLGAAGTLYGTIALLDDSKNARDDWARARSIGNPSAPYINWTLSNSEKNAIYGWDRDISNGNSPSVSSDGVLGTWNDFSRAIAGNLVVGTLYLMGDEQRGRDWENAVKGFESRYSGAIKEFETAVGENIPLAMIGTLPGFAMFPSHVFKDTGKFTFESSGSGATAFADGFIRASAKGAWGMASYVSSVGDAFLHNYIDGGGNSGIFYQGRIAESAKEFLGTEISNYLDPQDNRYGISLAQPKEYRGLGYAISQALLLGGLREAVGLRKVEGDIGLSRGKFASEIAGEVKTGFWFDAKERAKESFVNTFGENRGPVIYESIAGIGDVFSGVGETISAGMSAYQAATSTVLFPMHVMLEGAKAPWTVGKEIGRSSFNESASSGLENGLNVMGARLLQAIPTQWLQNQVLDSLGVSYAPINEPSFVEKMGMVLFPEKEGFNTWINTVREMGLEEAVRQSHIYSSFEQTNKELTENVLRTVFEFSPEHAKMVAESGLDYGRSLSQSTVSELRTSYGDKLNTVDKFLGKISEAGQIYETSGKNVNEVARVINEAVGIAAQEISPGINPKDILGDFRVLPKETYENLSQVRDGINRGIDSGALVMSLDSARELMQNSAASLDAVKSESRQLEFSFGKDSLKLKMAVTDNILNKAAEIAKEEERTQGALLKGIDLLKMSGDEIEGQLRTNLVSAIPNVSLREMKAKEQMVWVEGLRTARENAGREGVKEYNQIYWEANAATQSAYLEGKPTDSILMLMAEEKDVLKKAALQGIKECDLEGFNKAYEKRFGVELTLGEKDALELFKEQYLMDYVEAKGAVKPIERPEDVLDMMSASHLQKLQQIPVKELGEVLKDHSLTKVAGEANRLNRIEALLREVELLGEDLRKETEAKIQRNIEGKIAEVEGQLRAFRQEYKQQGVDISNFGEFIKGKWLEIENNIERDGKDRIITLLSDGQSVQLLVPVLARISPQIGTLYAIRAARGEASVYKDYLESQALTVKVDKNSGNISLDFNDKLLREPAAAGKLEEINAFVKGINTYLKELADQNLLGNNVDIAGLGAFISERVKSIDKEQVMPLVFASYLAFAKHSIGNKAIGRGENPEDKFRDDVATGQLKMILGLQDGFNVHLTAGGAKSDAFLVEMIVNYLNGEKIGSIPNQVLVVRNDIEKDSTVAGDKGNVNMVEFLKMFRMELVDGDHLSLSNGINGELTKHLNDGNAITVFSMENFGHLRNRNQERSLIEGIFNQDVVRFDEFHIPFSDKTTYILSAEEPTKLADNFINGAENAHRVIASLIKERKLTQESDIDKAKENHDKEALFYEDNNGKWGLTRQTIDLLKQEGLSTHEIGAFFEARNIDRWTLSETKDQIIPHSKGSAEATKIFSDRFFLAAAYAKLKAEGILISNNNGQNKLNPSDLDLNAIKDNLKTSTSSSQATLSEVLRFKDGADVLGASGTLSAVEAMLLFNLGKGVANAGETLGLETADVKGKTAKEAYESIMPTLLKDQATLIFVKDRNVMSDLQGRINKDPQLRGKEIIIINEHTASDEINKKIQNCIGENKGWIVISNERAATGIDYKGIFDVVVYDAHNWGYSDLVQAINRNRRGDLDRLDENSGKRIVLYDQAKLTEQNISGRSKTELEQRVSISKGVMDINAQELERSTRMRDALNISDALVFQIGEAAVSRGLIEQLKNMVQLAQGSGNKEQAAKIEDLLKKAIEYKENYQLELSEIGQIPEARVRETLKQSASKIEGTMEEIINDKGMSDFIKGYAQHILSEVAQVKEGYDSIYANYNWSLQHAVSLMGVAQVAKRLDFMRNIYTEEIKNSSVNSHIPLVQLIEHARYNTAGAYQGDVARLSLEARQEILSKVEYLKNMPNGSRGAPEARRDLVDKVLQYLPASTIPEGQHSFNLTNIIEQLQNQVSPEVAGGLDYYGNLINVINTIINPQEGTEASSIPFLDNAPINKYTIADALVSLINPNYTYFSIAGALGTYNVLPQEARYSLKQAIQEPVVMSIFLSQPHYVLDYLSSSEKYNYSIDAFKSVITANNLFAPEQITQINQSAINFAGMITDLIKNKDSKQLEQYRLPTSQKIRDLMSQSLKSLNKFNIEESEAPLALPYYSAVYQLLFKKALHKEPKIQDYFEELMLKDRQDQTTFEKEIILPIYYASFSPSGLSELGSAKLEIILTHYLQTSNKQEAGELLLRYPFLRKLNKAKVQSIKEYLAEAQALLGSGKILRDDLARYESFVADITDISGYTGIESYLLAPSLKTRYLRSYRVMSDLVNEAKGNILGLFNTLGVQYDRENMDLGVAAKAMKNALKADPLLTEQNPDINRTLNTYTWLNYHSNLQGKMGNWYAPHFRAEMMQRYMQGLLDYDKNLLDAKEGLEQKLIQEISTGSIGKEYINKILPILIIRLREILLEREQAIKGIKNGKIRALKEEKLNAGKQILARLEEAKNNNVATLEELYIAISLDLANKVKVSVLPFEEHEKVEINGRSDDFGRGDITPDWLIRLNIKLFFDPSRGVLDNPELWRQDVKGTTLFHEITHTFCDYIGKEAEIERLTIGNSDNEEVIDSIVKKDDLGSMTPFARKKFYDLKELNMRVEKEALQNAFDATVDKLEKEELSQPQDGSEAEVAAEIAQGVLEAKMESVNPKGFLKGLGLTVDNLSDEQAQEVMEKYHRRAAELEPVIEKIRNIAKATEEKDREAAKRILDVVITQLEQTKTVSGFESQEGYLKIVLPILNILLPYRYESDIDRRVYGILTAYIEGSRETGGGTVLEPEIGIPFDYNQMEGRDASDLAKAQPKAAKFVGEISGVGFRGTRGHLQDVIIVYPKVKLVIKKELPQPGVEHLIPVTLESVSVVTEQPAPQSEPVLELEPPAVKPPTVPLMSEVTPPSPRIPQPESSVPTEAAKVKAAILADNSKFERINLSFGIEDEFILAGDHIIILGKDGEYRVHRVEQVPPRALSEYPDDYIVKQLGIDNVGGAIGNLDNIIRNDDMQTSILRAQGRTKEEAREIAMRQGALESFNTTMESLFEGLDYIEQGKDSKEIEDRISGAINFAKVLLAELEDKYAEYTEQEQMQQLRDAMKYTGIILSNFDPQSEINTTVDMGRRKILTEEFKTTLQAMGKLRKDFGTVAQAVTQGSSPVTSSREEILAQAVKAVVGGGNIIGNETAGQGGFGSAGKVQLPEKKQIPIDESSSPINNEPMQVPVPPIALTVGSVVGGLSSNRQVADAIVGIAASPISLFNARNAEIREILPVKSYNSHLTTGVAPPAWNTSSSLSEFDALNTRGKLGSLVATVTRNETNAGAQIATSRSGEEGQGAEGASSNIGIRLEIAEEKLGDVVKAGSDTKDVVGQKTAITSGSSSAISNPPEETASGSFVFTSSPLKLEDISLHPLTFLKSHEECTIRSSTGTSYTQAEIAKMESWARKQVGDFAQAMEQAKAKFDADKQDEDWYRAEARIFEDLISTIDKLNSDPQITGVDTAELLRRVAEPLDNSLLRTNGNDVIVVREDTPVETIALEYARRWVALEKLISALSFSERRSLRVEALKRTPQDVRDEMLLRRIEAVRGDVKGVKQEVGEVKQEVGEVKQEVGEVKQEVKNLGTTVEEQGERIAQLEIQLEKKIEEVAAIANRADATAKVAVRVYEEYVNKGARVTGDMAKNNDCFVSAVKYLDEELGRTFEGSQGLSAEEIVNKSKNVLKFFTFSKANLLGTPVELLKKLIFLQKAANGVHHAFLINEINNDGIVVFVEDNFDHQAKIARAVSWDELAQKSGEIVVIGLAKEKEQYEAYGGKEIAAPEEMSKISGMNSGNGSTGGAQGSGSQGGSTGGSQGGATGAAGAGDEGNGGSSPVGAGLGLPEDIALFANTGLAYSGVEIAGLNTVTLNPNAEATAPPVSTSSNSLNSSANILGKVLIGTTAVLASILGVPAIAEAAKLIFDEKTGYLTQIVIEKGDNLGSILEAIRTTKDIILPESLKGAYWGVKGAVAGFYELLKVLSAKIIAGINLIYEGVIDVPQSAGIKIKVASVSQPAPAADYSWLHPAGVFDRGPINVDALNKIADKYLVQKVSWLSRFIRDLSYATGLSETAVALILAVIIGVVLGLGVVGAWSYISKQAKAKSAGVAEEVVSDQEVDVQGEKVVQEEPSPAPKNFRQRAYEVINSLKQENTLDGWKAAETEIEGLGKELRPHTFLNIFSFGYYLDRMVFNRAKGALESAAWRIADKLTNGEAEEINYEGAIYLYTRITVFNPRDRVALYRLGTAYSRNGNYEEATKAFYAAVRLSRYVSRFNFFKKNTHQIFRENGEALLALGEYENAIANFDSALEYAPKAARQSIKERLFYAEFMLLKGKEVRFTLDKAIVTGMVVDAGDRQWNENEIFLSVVLNVNGNEILYRLSAIAEQNDFILNLEEPFSDKTAPVEEAPEVINSGAGALEEDHVVPQAPEIQAETVLGGILGKPLAGRVVTSEELEALQVVYEEESEAAEVDYTVLINEAYVQGKDEEVIRLFLEASVSIDLLQLRGGVEDTVHIVARTIIDKEGYSEEAKQKARSAEELIITLKSRQGDGSSSPINEAPLTSANIPAENSLTITSSPVNKSATSFLGALISFLEKYHIYSRAADQIKVHPEERIIGEVNSQAPPFAFIANWFGSILKAVKNGGKNGELNGKQGIKDIEDTGICGGIKSSGNSIPVKTAGRDQAERDTGNGRGFIRNQALDTGFLFVATGLVANVYGNDLVRLISLGFIISFALLILRANQLSSFIANGAFNKEGEGSSPINEAPLTSANIPAENSLTITSSPVNKSATSFLGALISFL